MSYFFGLGQGWLKNRAKVQKIAQKHGAWYVQHIDAGCSCGYGCDYSPSDRGCETNRRHWFETDNLGMPHDRDVESAVISELEAAGLLPPPAEKPEKRKRYVVDYEGEIIREATAGDEARAKRTGYAWARSSDCRIATAGAE